VGMADCVEITVDYSVGEIIAGILGGGGIAIAGTAYAMSVTKSKEENSSSNDV